METALTTTSTSQAPAFTIAVAIDKKSALIIGVAVFVALLGALIIYKQL